MSDEAAAERMDMAIKTGEQFSERYYKILDQERHKINTMYHQDAVLAWNGNPVEGIGNIKSFMMEKLPKSNTFLNSLDAQPVHDSAVQGKTTVLVVVSGEINTLYLAQFKMRLLSGVWNDEVWCHGTETIPAELHVDRREPEVESGH